MCQWTLDRKLLQIMTIYIPYVAISDVAGWGGSSGLSPPNKKLSTFPSFSPAKIVILLALNGSDRRPSSDRRERAATRILDKGKGLPKM